MFFPHNREWPWTGQGTAADGSLSSNIATSNHVRSSSMHASLSNHVFPLVSRNSNLEVLFFSIFFFAFPPFPRFRPGLHTELSTFCLNVKAKNWLGILGDGVMGDEGFKNGRL